ncbi:uncharacterized protein EMH_0006890 [Eimeria mitis]|uniref:Uncharacterized protein n=1 Tax=Eimeria mitis TaxID=44415 RepID=U6K0S1_9EIME|nr:uncharacterized protein EMH_0006890 [Eimeria mitis]CDJ30591.1 hypothetical protein, conserved [Eimeria mitis]
MFQSPPQPLLAKDSLLAALEAVKRSADSGSVYLLESSVQEALPEHAEAKAKVAAIRELVRDLEQLKQERARLAMFRHQTPKEIRSEYAQMMLTGLFTGLAAAIHPIFFVVCFLSVHAGTVKMDEVNRTVKEKRAALNAHIDALAHMVGQ